jgi:CheY-like chemotaxis protein
MKTPLPKTLLIIEDDALLRESLVETAQSTGWTVKSSDTAEAAIALAGSFRPTVVFSDVHLSHGDGRRVLAVLREDKAMRDCQFVLMTGDWVGASKRDSEELSADAYLPKPFTLEEFLSCLEERHRQANL